jgi:cyclopropane fatty-acyl-phospholipid synthase-like methyltransferase
MDERLLSPVFPRAAKYHPEWIIEAASGGAHALWLTEWLASAMELRSGMRVLDLGCGRASSSIFLHREFGVQVWATDQWITAAENAKRISRAGIKDGVIPIHADARALPFETEFFDAVVSMTSSPTSERTICT